jgi:hypothetical protein
LNILLCVVCKHLIHIVWKYKVNNTAPNAPLGLHCSRIGKCSMKKFGISCQLRNKLCLIVNHHFSLVKDAMNAPHLCKLRKVCPTGTGHGTTVLTFLHFPIDKGGTKTTAPLSIAEVLSFRSLDRLLLV